MKHAKASETARLSALLRAAHVYLDEKPWIFNDSLAAALAGCDETVSLDQALSSFHGKLSEFGSESLAHIWIRAARLSLALRARYVEEKLEAAINRGVKQFVILGAGYESFAYRRPDLGRRIRVYEIDHPLTQQHKVTRLQQLNIETPENLLYIPIDFGAGVIHGQTLSSMMLSAGYQSDQPGLFVCMGVLWYLEDTAIHRTLREIATTGIEIEILLDYQVPRDLLDETHQRINDLSMKLVESHGEQGGRYFTSSSMNECLNAAGFKVLEDVSAEEATLRYCSGRSCSLQIPPISRLAHARVSNHWNALEQRYD